MLTNQNDPSLFGWWFEKLNVSVVTGLRYYLIDLYQISLKFTDVKDVKKTIYKFF